MIRLIACYLIVAFTFHAQVSANEIPLWKQLYELADSLEEKAKQYDSAWVLAEKAFSMAKDSLGPNDTALASILITMSDIKQGLSDYQNAFKLAFEALTISRSALGSEHIKVGKIYTQIGWLHFENKEYDDAKHLFNKALLATERHVGRQNREYTWILYWLGEVYVEMEQYGLADSILEQAYEISISDTATYHGTIVGVLVNLVTVKEHFGEWQLALKLQKELVEVEINEHGELNSKVSSAYNKLGRIYDEQKKYENAIGAFGNALAIAISVHGENSVAASDNIFWLAIIRYHMGHLLIADSLMKETLNIRLQHFGPHDFKVCELYQQRTIFQHKLGNFESADSLFHLATQIDTTANNENFKHLWQIVVDYLDLCLENDRMGKLQEIGKRFDTLFNPANHEKVGLEPLLDYYFFVARYFTKVNNFRFAEAAYLKMKSLYGEEYGICSEPYLQAERWLGSFYYDVGYSNHDSDFLREALRLLQHSISHANGKDTSKAAILVSWLLRRAKLFKTFGMIEYMERDYDSALAIWPSLVTFDDSTYLAGHLSAIADVKAQLGENVSSNSLIRQAISLVTVHGIVRDTTTYLKILCNMVQTALELEQYDRAILLTDTLMHVIRTARNQSIDTLDLLQQVGSFEKDNYNEFDYFHDFSEQYLNELKSKALKAEGHSILRMSKKLRWPIGNCLTAYFKIDKPSAEIAESAAELVESAHGVVTNAVLERQKSIKESGGDSALSEINAALAHSLFYEVANHDSMYIQRVDSILMMQAQAEYDLLKIADTASKSESNPDSGINHIVSLLPDGAKTIEYFRWNNNENRHEGLDHYLGICRSKEKLLDIVDLGLAEQIDSLIEMNRSYMRFREHFPTKAETQELKEIGRQLYNGLIAPFKRSIIDAAYLFLIPDGSLHMLSFATLVDDDNRYLIEQIPVHFLSTNKYFEDDSPQAFSAKEIIVFANPIFSMETPQGKQVIAYEAADSGDLKTSLRSLSSDCLLLSNRSLATLPYTEQEAQLIAKAVKNNSEISVNLKLGALASEREFKENVEGKSIIHLATHGFYLSSGCLADSAQLGVLWRSQYFYQNPYLMSGIFLTPNLNPSTVGDSNQFEDGILTALEISSLDLRGTELVVLSACETGLGKIEASEGVYGLRRAFLEAGAQTVISALWSIDDKTTADMMSQLYVHSNELIPDRLREVQLARISKLRKDGFADHPFTWAHLLPWGIGNKTYSRVNF